jgi:D-xylonolactonase
MTRGAERMPRCLWAVSAQLGEGPVWIPRDNAVYFVDILGHAIHCWTEQDVRRTWRTASEPGFIFPTTRGDYICGLRDGLYRFAPTTGAFELLLAVEAEKAKHRINDGFVDPAGRLWFGTMHEDARTTGGALYSVGAGPTLHLHDMDYAVTNGPAMSPDARTLYHSDSARRMIYAFDHRDGLVCNKRPFITWPEGLAPDGVAVDRQGHLWIAIYNGWRLERYSPLGEKLDEIRFPCANVTKPVFGGKDLSTLYVTTARTGLSAADLSIQPLAGALFAVQVAVAGLAPSMIDWD